MAQYIGKAIRDESGAITGYDNIRRIEGNNARPRGDWGLLCGDLTKYPKVEFIDSCWMVTEDETEKLKDEQARLQRLDDKSELRKLEQKIDEEIDKITSLASLRTFLKRVLPKIARRLTDD